MDNTVDGETFDKNVPFAITSIDLILTNILFLETVMPSLVTSAFEIENAITVAPNPASNFVSIQTPSFVNVESVSIYNHLGQLVATKNSANFSITELSTGVLFLEIKTSEGTFHKKMIKK